MVRLPNQTRRLFCQALPITSAAFSYIFFLSERLRANFNFRKLRCNIRDVLTAHIVPMVTHYVANTTIRVISRTDINYNTFFWASLLMYH